MFGGICPSEEYPGGNVPHSSHDNSRRRIVLPVLSLVSSFLLRCFLRRCDVPTVCYHSNVQNKKLSCRMQRGRAMLRVAR